MCSESPGCIINADANTVGLGKGLRFCNSNKLPDEADTAGPKPQFGFRTFPKACSEEH